jgi:Uma2 family endonuclease
MTLATETLSEYERERGKPMPSFNHGVVQANLLFEIKNRHAGQFTLVSELTLDMEPPMTPDISIYPNSVQPDWNRDVIRMVELPLTVIEILSPTQGVQDLLDKVYRYLDAGVKSCWLVQPSFRLIAIYTADPNPLIFTEGNATDPTNDITVSVDQVFTQG